MQPAEGRLPEQLVGRRVVFQESAEHEHCWHTRAGLQTGVVLKPVPTLAQKAELLGAEMPVPPALQDAELEVPRVWVRADPCPQFPRGCETAVELSCLSLAEAPGPSS